MRKTGRWEIFYFIVDDDLFVDDSLELMGSLHLEWRRDEEVICKT